MSSKRDQHSTRLARAARRSRRHKPRRPRAKLPDLQPALNAFLEGLGLARCALAALRHADNWGPEEITLQAGVKALERVYSDLDGIETQLHKYCERAAGGRR